MMREPRRTGAAGGQPARWYQDLMLLPQHETLLRASAIAPDVAAARGYKSADTKAMLGRLGFGKSQQHAPALLLPIRSAVTGAVAFYQARPDVPRMNGDGKSIKYETPANVRMAVDAHPFIRERLGDPSVPLFITEGIRKADAAVSRGLCCLALLGVWNWRGRNEHGGTAALTDWEAIALNGRDVYVAYDSDVMHRREVHAALRRLAAFLEARGARVHFVYLPAGDGGAKVGLDDFFAAGHAVEDLMALATDELRTPASGPVPVLADVLDQVAAFLRRFVVFASPHQATACTLWTTHTHVHDHFDVSPFLHVGSPEKRSGKTRLLEVLELLVRAAWRVVQPSEAVLFRKIDAAHPTLLLDEVDAIFARGRDDVHEPLRALLNAGNRRGVTIPRCVGDGTEIRLMDFQVFTPRVLAGIGAIPDTVADRSIPIRLQRRAPHETIDRFRFREASEDARPICEMLERWALAAGDQLERARPEVPAVLNDRAAELWEPLLAIADLAGGEWPGRAREAAVVLHGDSLAQDETLGVALLRAVRDVFTEAEADRLTTAALLGVLVERDDGPWAEWWGKQVAEGSARGPGSRLARLLRPYGITPKNVRSDDGRVSKGYAVADFEDAFRRYLPFPQPERRYNATSVDNQGPAGQNENATDPSCSVIETARKPLQDMGCSVVASSDAQEGDGAATDPLLAEAVRRWGPPVEIRSPDGDRRAVGDDEGQRVWLRALYPDRAAWISTASAAEITAAVEAVLVGEGPEATDTPVVSPAELEAALAGQGEP